MTFARTRVAAWGSGLGLVERGVLRLPQERVRRGRQRRPWAGLIAAHFAISADASRNLTVHTGSEVDPSTPTV
jgi:hypothetical protein